MSDEAMLNKSHVKTVRAASKLVEPQPGANCPMKTRHPSASHLLLPAFPRSSMQRQPLLPLL